MSSYRTLLDDLRAPPSFATSDDDFVASVMENCRRDSLVFRAPNKRARGVGIFVFASLAAVMMLGLLRLRHEGHVAARGSLTSEVDAPSVEALLVRNRVLLPLERAELRAGDGIAVRIKNPSGQRRYLLVFALDAANTVHWIYPAYVDSSTNPQAIELEPSDDPHLLAEVVEPEHPAEGPLRVVAANPRPSP